MKAGDWQLANINYNSWPFFGEFNYLNALAAIAAAANVGIAPDVAIKALQEFKGVKRRCEVVAQYNNTKIYSDFAHHPTAIKVTLDAIKWKLRDQQRVLAIVDICSNTMRSQVHQKALGPAVQAAEQVYFYHNKPIDLNVNEIMNKHNNICGVFHNETQLIEQLLQQVRDGDQIILMSNGALSGIQQKLITELSRRFQTSMAIG